ncbi:(Fe-S)-binding protein [Escherichia coli]|nr:(Fe-S)-binding protein [Escherichia coli]
MNVNFFVTCIGDALKSRMARDSVLLLEKLGCRVNFPEKQGCCGQPAINSGYIKEAIPGMKNLIAALEDNDDPIISPAGSCTYAIKSYPTYLADEPEWASRAEKVVHLMEVRPEYLIGADVSCLLNISGRLQREGQKVKVMHIAEVLMSR